MTEVRDNSERFDPAPRKKAGEIKRKKFAAQMEEGLLDDIRGFAKKEGRQFQAVLEDAVRAYLKDQRGYVMDPKVKAAHEYTLKKYADLYKRLAQ